MRQAASQSRQTKQGVEHQHQFFAVKFVEVGGRQQARQAGSQGVCRHQQTKTGVTDSKQLGELRTQRHHDHEIKNMGELNARKGQEQPKFTAARQRAYSKRGHEGRGGVQRAR